MVKRLIYPLEYFADVTILKNDELNKISEVLSGIFLGMDVKTGEEVLVNTFQKESIFREKADFFKENDVLYMDYEYIFKFSKAKIITEKESFDCVQKFYRSLKSDGIPEEEINRQMMRVFKFEKEKPKKLVKWCDYEKRNK